MIYDIRYIPYKKCNYGTFMPKGSKRQIFHATGATSSSFFGLRQFHWYVWTRWGSNAKLRTWIGKRFWNLGLILLDCFPRRKNIQWKNINCWHRNSQTLRRNFPTLQRNFPALCRNFPALWRNFPKPWQNSFSTFPVHGLAESMEKRSFVLSNPHKHFSLATSFLDVLRQNFRATSEINAVWDSGTFFARNT